MMDLKNTISALERASKTKYYKFIYKGDGRCKTCLKYNGKVFPKDKLPVTHQNCQCAEETNDPVDIALGKFLPEKECFVGNINFNANRRKLEEQFGTQIDNNPHSEPQHKLADSIKQNGYNGALYKNTVLREKNLRDLILMETIFRLSAWGLI